jgi:chromosome segregation ATPase
VDLNDLAAVLEDMLASAPPPGHPPAPESRENSARPENGAPSSSGLAPLQQALNRVKDDLADLKKELRERNDQIEKQQSRLAEQAALVEDLRAALTSLRDNMDKEAALSAARVIREELASLLKDGPPAS